VDAAEFLAAGRCLNIADPTPDLVILSSHQNFQRWQNKKFVSRFSETAVSDTLISHPNILKALAPRYPCTTDFPCLLNANAPLSNLMNYLWRPQSRSFKKFSNSFATDGGFRCEFSRIISSREG
jgi:hypothetical protein